MGRQTALLEAPQQRVQGSVYVADRYETANSAKHYKPFIHRTVSFAALLAVALALVALLEYANRVLPDIGWEGDAPQRRSVVNRWEEGLESVALSVPSSSLYTPTILPSSPTTTASPSAVTSPIPVATSTAYSDTGTTFTTREVSTAASSTITVPQASTSTAAAYLDTMTTSFEIPSITTAGYLDTSSTIIQQQIGAAASSTMTLLPTPISAAYLSSGTTIDQTAYMGTTTLTIEQTQFTASTSSPSAYLNANTVTIVATGQITDYLDVDTSTTTSAAYLATTIKTQTVLAISYLPTDTSVSAYPNANTVTAFGGAPITDYLGVDTSTTTNTAYLDTTLIPQTAPYVSYLSSDTSTQPLIAQVTSSCLLTDTNSQSIIAQSSPNHNCMVQIITTTLTTQPPITLSTTTTTATLGMASVAFALPFNSTNEISTNKSLTFFTRSIYFCGAYLPIIIAVWFRVVIGWLYVTTKMLEPFRILTQSKTISAKDFFNINYLSASDTLEPYKAMMSGHWLMLCTSLLYLAVELLSPFAAEILHFYWSCESTENSTLTCAAALWIDVSVVRILQGLLSFTAMMLAIIWYMLRSRPSELRSDPSSIITVASLLHHPETIDGLRALNQLASKSETIKSLDGYSFRLGTYEGRDGNERYGLIASNNVQFDQPSNASDPLMITKDSKTSPSSIPQEPVSTRPKRRKPLHLVRDIVLGSTIAAILIIVAVYYVASGNSGFNIFMNSNSFGPRFLVTCVGVIIHSQWARIDRECAVDEPFRRLYRGSATAESTILPPKTFTPVSTFIASVYQRNFFVAHVAFVTLMSEVLIIVLPGVPFSPGEIWQAGMMSIYLAMAILGLMLLTFVALMLRPKGPGLPRKPNTLGSMLMYLCDSSMTSDFTDLSCLGTTARDRWVREKDRLYCLKNDLGTNGCIRWQVDYDTRGEKRGALMSDF
ncbi:hypothetical protein MMC27_004486 [Xylographa pallens]|nr:hypothetical protein [Xylographa pallens]